MESRIALRREAQTALAQRGAGLQPFLELPLAVYLQRSNAGPVSRVPRGQDSEARPELNDDRESLIIRDLDD